MRFVQSLNAYVWRTVECCLTVRFFILAPLNNGAFFLGDKMTLLGLSLRNFVAIDTR